MLLGSPASASGLFSTTPPLRSDNAVEAGSLYRSWFNTCRHQHEKCKVKVSGTLVDEEPGPELPTRILDLGDPTAGDLALLESKGRRGDYCALSYCWGPPDSQTFLTTRETLQQRLQGIKFNDLPKTFQDAVQITRGLGMRYLWVDGLCIIQGDKDDWESESERMGAVYENASLVIAASGSASAKEGCFVTHNRDLSAVDLPYYSEDGQTEGLVHACAHIPGEDGDSQPYFGPLQQRGWALQEAYFARRALHFMPGGPSWCCRELQHDERGTYFDMQFWKDWEDILDDYTRRQLTYYESDRLMAIKGYAMELQKKTGDIYNRGVFLSQLPRQLLWINRHGPSLEDIAEMPSWTWASQGGDKYFWGSQFSIESPHVAPVISHDKFRFDDSELLTTEGRTIVCYTSRNRLDQEYTDLRHTPLTPLQDLFEMAMLGGDFRPDYLTEPSDSPNPRPQGLAYFDDGCYSTVHVLPLVTDGAWGGSTYVFNTSPSL